MDGDPEPFSILPLALLTLAENVFKHGLLTDETHPATITLRITDDGQLTYNSSNAKKTGAPLLPRAEKVGLNNLKLRLETAYPGRYQLQTRDEISGYHLELNLQL